jgi:hypothetical protein
MPRERMSAILQTREFLQRLASAEWSSEIPPEVRREAQHLLRHYPLPLVLSMLPAALPSWFDSPPSR